MTLKRDYKLLFALKTFVFEQVLGQLFMEPVMKSPNKFQLDNLIFTRNIIVLVLQYVL